MTKKRDLTGQRFGRLLVIKELPKENEKNVNFSIGDIKAKIGTEEFAKEISKHLEQILKS